MVACTTLVRAQLYGSVEVPRIYKTPSRTKNKLLCIQEIPQIQNK